MGRFPLFSKVMQRLPRQTTEFRLSSLTQEILPLRLGSLFANSSSPLPDLDWPRASFRAVTQAFSGSLLRVRRGLRSPSDGGRSRAVRVPGTCGAVVMATTWEGRGAIPKRGRRISIRPAPSLTPGANRTAKDSPGWMRTRRSDNGCFDAVESVRSMRVPVVPRSVSRRCLLRRLRNKVESVPACEEQTEVCEAQQ